MSRPRSLVVVDYNVERDRDKSRVLRELNFLESTFGPDAFTLQETSDYVVAIEAWAKDHDYVVHRGKGRGSTEALILVHFGLVVTRPRFDSIADGWWTIRGGYAPPRWFVKVLIDYWCALATLHNPPHHTAKHRRNDYAAMMLRTLIFLRGWFHARVAVADWNEPAGSEEPGSPAAIARKADARVYTDGPGSIDYAIAKGCTVKISVIRNPLFGSDHRPRLLTIREHVDA